MATNIALVIENLRSFYDFAGKTIVSVGAGGGQFIDYGRQARKVIAIDQDAEALAQLRTRVDSEGLSSLFELIQSDFYDTTRRADTILFEFCLHEMPDVLRALQHARTLAPDIVVADHAPGSEWAYYVVEEDKVQKSSEAMKRFGIRRQEVFHGDQRFSNHEELLAKVSVQGPEAIRRAGKLRDVTNIVIPMSYAVTLL